MEKTTLAMELGVGDHRQVIFQTHPVREPPHRPGRADEIPEFVGAIQRSGVVVDVVMNVLAVCVAMVIWRNMKFLVASVIFQSLLFMQAQMKS